MTQFINLPDDCCYLIFVRLSTSTLLSCRRVSRAWLRNQQQVCRSRKTLVLLQGNSPVQLLTNSHYQSAFISHGIDQNGLPIDFDCFLQHNQVNVRTFDRNVTHFLSETFPNVDTLIVVHRSILSQDVIVPLLHLLQQYSSQVVNLQMYFHYLGVRPSAINPNIRQVIRQLNSMTALERVTLESHNPPGLALRVSKKDFKFLTRIKEFYCYAPELSKRWYKALRRLEQTGTVSQLERIALGNNKWAVGDPLGQWLLANRFTHLPYYANFGNVDNSKHFVQSIAHFHSLTTFTIDHQYISQLANKLTTLSHHCPCLVHIKIYVRNRSLFAEPFDPTTIKPLESVKALHLVLRYVDATQIDLQAQIGPLVHSFPNLVSIAILHSIYEPTRTFECVNFFGQLKSALGCESLRTVYRRQTHINIFTN